MTVKIQGPREVMDDREFERRLHRWQARHHQAESGVPYPFVYASGRRCAGYVSFVSSFPAIVSWNFHEDGRAFKYFVWPKRYEVFCSRQGHHWRSPKVVFTADTLPEELAKHVGREVVLGPPLDDEPPAWVSTLNDPKHSLAEEPDDE